MENEELKFCPRMSREPYAGAWGLCYLKVGNNCKCDYTDKPGWEKCEEIQHQKYEEMLALIEEDK